MSLSANTAASTREAPISVIFFSIAASVMPSSRMSSTTSTVRPRTLSRGGRRQVISRPWMSLL